MNFIREMLNEKGNISSIRVMSFISLLTGCGIGIAGVCKSIPDYSGLSLLVSTFLSAAFIGKVSQKSIEYKGLKSEEKS